MRTKKMNIDIIIIVICSGVIGFLVGKSNEDDSFREGYRAAVRDFDKLFESMEYMTKYWKELFDSIKPIIVEEEVS